MAEMIAIIDYQAGNLTSVRRALDYLGFESEVTEAPERIEKADRVIFPGVGAAGEAMHNLRGSGLDEVICGCVKRGTPFLGICLGYQVLFAHSDEDNVDCLGLLAGRVVRFDDDMLESGTENPRPLKVPEMGWNRVRFRDRTHPVWRDVPADSEFYFVHSYYPKTRPEITCATTVYGIEYACGVAQENLVAFQFHPEKSGRPGLALLRNFCTWKPGMNAKC
jgi:glutamine amidotransferase